MHTASLAVPVPGTPASNNAWVLASVAVVAALTSAASPSATGTLTTTLMVPGAHGLMASSASAAHVGAVMPTVAQASTPPSSPWPRVRSAAVIMPTPGPTAPAPAAISSRWRWGSVRP